MVMNYIGADVHVSTTSLAVERNGKITQQYQVPITIPSLRGILEAVRGEKTLVIEEGCMLGWLYRNLESLVKKMIVCDPRRNHYIAKDGDKDDKIDAAKLAELVRGVLGQRTWMSPKRCFVR